MMLMLLASPLRNNASNRVASVLSSSVALASGQLEPCAPVGTATSRAQAVLIAAFKSISF
jgi:hypothetical protein